VIRLGLRLASLGGRWSLVPTALTALAVAFGTSILLFALSFQPALEVPTTEGHGAKPLACATRRSRSSG